MRLVRFVRSAPKGHRGRRPALTQRNFAFWDRAKARERSFKRAIAAFTGVTIAALVMSFEAGRHAVRGVPNAVAGAYGQARDLVLRRWIGLEPTREETDALVRLRRERTEADTRRSIERFYASTSDDMRRLFDAAGMAPGECVVGVGRANNGFLLSSGVFERDEVGRAYRFKPNVASVWLRQITLDKGPFALFLVPDTGEARRAAAAVGGIVDEASRQTTNSWGLRGPEPNPAAPIRGIILGDSFMQGMFNDDEHTPPIALERYLARAWDAEVSILNTGHIGYAPEQYCRTLQALGPRFRPHFVVVSVCPNDFGNDNDVIAGGGDDWDEAAYWLGEILHWCRAANVPCVLVPAPLDRFILGVRKDAWYPGRISNLFQGTSYAYCNPFEYFLEEHLRAYRRGAAPGRSALFNHQINDNHFSPRGAEVWAEVVGERLVGLMAKPAGKAGLAAPAGADRAASADAGGK